MLAQGGSIGVVFFMPFSILNLFRMYIHGHCDQTQEHTERIKIDSVLLKFSVFVTRPVLRFITFMIVLKLN